MANQIKIIHVDDDEKELKWLSKITNPIHDIILSQSFNNAKDALEYLENNQCDIIILDIELPGENGFWLAEKIKQLDIFIVFATSHVQYALQAFEVYAMDYILKPITQNSIERIINHYHNIIAKEKKHQQVQIEKINEVLNDYHQKNTYPKKVFINNIGKTTILYLTETVYLNSMGVYTTFKTLYNEKTISSKPIKFYADILKNHPDFLRIHRTIVINKKFVKNILRNGYKFNVTMVTGDVLPVSPILKDEIYDLLKD